MYVLWWILQQTYVLWLILKQIYFGRFWSRYTLSDFEANTHWLILKQYFGEGKGQNLWRAENLITQLHGVGKFNAAIFRFYGRSRLTNIKCLRAKVGDQIRGHAMMYCKFATNSYCLLWYFFGCIRISCTNSHWQVSKEAQNILPHGFCPKRGIPPPSPHPAQIQTFSEAGLMELYSYWALVMIHASSHKNFSVRLSKSSLSFYSRIADSTIGGQL